MFSPRWRKVMRDLWLNKTRTALVVFSIAVGAFAVGVIINSQLVLDSSLTETYEATKPAHANILTLTPFDEQLAKSVRNVEGVEEAEARRNIIVRLKTGPDEWVNLQLLAVPDYNDIRVSKVSPDGGAWPPENHDILIERSALGLTKAAVGDVVTIKTPSGQERQVRIAGQTHDLQASLYVLSGIAYGHINVDMLEWLGEPSSFGSFAYCGVFIPNPALKGRAKRAKDVKTPSKPLLQGALASFSLLAPLFRAGRGMGTPQ